MPPAENVLSASALLIAASVPRADSADDPLLPAMIVSPVRVLKVNWPLLAEMVICTVSAAASMSAMVIALALAVENTSGVPR